MTSNNHSADTRHIDNGYKIPSEGYCDQPYVVQTDDGAWLCIMTTGSGHEGATGQHVVSSRSIDNGRSWSELVDVEPADGPEASYAVVLKVTSGRIYAFYNHNSDNIRQVKATNPPYSSGYCSRVDSLGYFVFKYSDDGGLSWSDERYRISVREMEIDRQNADAGCIRYFWNVGKPFVHNGAAFVSLHKVGGFGDGFFTSNEGVLLKSENLLFEPDPNNIEWETLPEGDHGIRAPSGGSTIASEHSYSVLSDGSFYCVYRTIDGHPGCSYSRDEGKSWSPPSYKKFADGRLIKHPRAANFAWRCSNGKYLYWFHNHGGNFIREDPDRRSNAYSDRNPVWLCGGIEVETDEGICIDWSQPEIVLYDDDPYIRMSYPDLIEEGGQYYLTETQKDIARVHKIAPDLLSGLWSEKCDIENLRIGLVLEKSFVKNEIIVMPSLPVFNWRSAESPYGSEDLRSGFSLELRLGPGLKEPLVILDSRKTDGQGVCLKYQGNGIVEFFMSDGRSCVTWCSDLGGVVTGRQNHVVVVVDGGPKLISFIVNGAFQDGGETRQFGWGRFGKEFRHANGTGALKVNDFVENLRIFNRPLRTFEAISFFKAEEEK
ncbi:MAG: sialidase family protein [Candidatus Latescibacterota bacterium]|nr:sialidase family protein [Candidatus Latescibacterota bacterium]